jgi:phage terminase large subunit
MRKPLSFEEARTLSELVQLSEGVRRAKEVAALDKRQTKMAAVLQSKGYVSMTSRKFMVVNLPGVQTVSF